MKNHFLVKRDSLFFWLFALIFILVAGFRGGTRDTDVYKYVYDHIYNFPLSSIGSFYDATGMEIGYGIISYIFQSFGFSFSTLLLLFSFLTFLFLKKTSDNLEINAFFVILCYLPVFYANHQLMQMRQGFAVAAVYCGISYIILNKNKLLAWFLFLIGFFIHNVVFALIITFFKYINNLINTEKINFYIKSILFVIIVFLFCRLITDFGLSALTDRIGNYSDTDYSEQRSFFHPANLRSVLLLFIFLIFRSKVKINKIYDYLVLLYSIGLGFRLGFYDFLILSGRISTLFTFSEIFIVPFLFKLRLKTLYSYIAILLYFLINLYINLYYQVPFVVHDYFKQIGS
ncbi:EpsG family protein [Acinetobacter baumannii]|uniref:EpsG family protein n=1 Tax=Acinetobacter baumannii TaxID=470 RepID=UPI000571753F|nr:EpsG family protein [Acinetobacter baumannii]